MSQLEYLPVIGALGGALIGGLSSFLANVFLSKRKDESDKLSTTFQIYAEVKAILEIASHRKYIEQLENINNSFTPQHIQFQTYQVQVPDSRFPVFKNSLPRLGLLDRDLQINIIGFYQILEAVIQDVKPGGLLNAEPSGAEGFQGVLRLMKQAIEIGDDILKIINKRYPYPKAW